MIKNKTSRGQSRGIWRNSPKPSKLCFAKASQSSPPPSSPQQATEYSAKENKCRASPGFTLIEIVIVLTIIGAIVAMVVGAMGTKDKNMRRTSMSLIRYIRHAYNEATITNQYYRLVFDLTDQKCLLETSEDPFYVVKEGDEQEELRLKNEERDTMVRTEDQATPKSAQGTFGEIGDDVIDQPIVVPSNIKITDFFVEHQKEKITEGKGYLYFFPKGYTEFSVIHLSDSDDEESVTLVVNPLTGNVDIFSEYIEAEEALEKMNEDQK